ncbi:MAG: single-stranded-DNA-specific exonuclease RecJ [Candidatus Obscuribacterales bacterium]|nr:single-stranded-DNA-specific exonuclease RecJ [Candidatus Obscuribacterales bacterium]
MSKKSWKFPPDISVDASLIEAAFGSELLAKLLVRRGLKTAETAKTFLDAAKYTATSPFELPNIERALERIEKAIDGQEKITVYGDYDVDGVTATSVLLTVLKDLGAQVDFYIPHRTNEGYGLNLKAVSILASKNRTKLIITCDCGVSNFAEINFAKSLGVDTVVVDHHTMPELLPPASATIHPKLLREEHPLYNLPGVGAAYKLCEALLIKKGMPEKADELLDYVTLGMIADLVPLIDENRYLVQIGLPKLVASKRPGIKALLSQSKGSGTDIVGFGIAPRINAVGRLADANLAVELMTTADEAKAEELAKQLERENERRQELCEKINYAADQMVASTVNLANDRAIVIYDEGWHHGVVGIVASRLVEKYNCPVFIGELHKEDGMVKGSARSVDGVDLYAVLKENEHLLQKWGGHKMAAGFAVEVGKAEALRSGITEACNRMLNGKLRAATLDIDAQVAAKDVTMDLANLVAKIAPFGMANKKPVLVMRELTCVGVRALGKEGKHSRLMLRDTKESLPFEAVMWNSRGRIPADGQQIDVAFIPEINEYNGTKRLQLVLVDWRPVGEADSVDDDDSSTLLPVSTVVDAAKRSQVAAVAQPVEAKTTDSVNAQADSAAVPSVRSVKLNFKDLRDHNSPTGLVESAARKLGSTVAIFGESCLKIPGIDFADRTAIGSAKNLLLWQYPPSLKVFRDLIGSSVREVYIVGGVPIESEDTKAFLKKLLGFVRFAVNKMEGKVPGEKLAVALGTTKMCVALGLTMLNKMGVLEWFAEDGVIYLDITGEPEEKPENIAEFRHLASSLKEVYEFRNWLKDSEFKEIQQALALNKVELHKENARRTDDFGHYDQPEQSRLAQEQNS